MLEQLATDIESYIRRHNGACATFLGAWTVGVAGWGLAAVAAPFTGGTSLAAAGASTIGVSTFMAACFTALGSWIFAAANGVFSPKVSAAQQAIDEDTEERKRLNEMLAEAGREERVNVSFLTLNLRKDRPDADQLRSIANSLRSEQSKADMEELLNSLE